LKAATALRDKREQQKLMGVHKPHQVAAEATRLGRQG
jgi:hypothetical protein